MIDVVRLTFNAFQENTYLVFDDTGECIIFDPGCSDADENAELSRVISERGLRPVRLINTHCHLDHIFGNKFVAETWGLGLETHQGEEVVLERGLRSAQMYGFPDFQESPMPSVHLNEGDTVSFGNTTLEILFTPGHSPASICFYNREQNFLIAGDVLFQGSIGRTDLPGGNYDTLMKSIETRLLTLPDHVEVFPGHGPSTTIGVERKQNPFILDWVKG